MPDPLSDNAALNEIAETLDDIVDSLAGDYDSISGSSTFSAIGDTLTTLRAAEPEAMKTVVSNSGDDPVQVFENDKIVLIVPPGESRELPLSGKGTIKVKCPPGDSSAAAIATFKKTVES